ncbi:MAG: DUF4234 domain-containing protein [Oscillospiraceae bacterium]|nr:DUF4234 domain-containing protein [Oscillospiraceae bacterium]
MNTKKTLVPSTTNRDFMIAIAGAGGAAVLSLLIRIIASAVFGWWFSGFGAIFSFLLMAAAAGLMFAAKMGKLPMFAVYIPAIILGIMNLFGGAPLIGLLYTGGAVVAMLACMGIFELPALDGKLLPGSKGVCLLAAGLFVGAVALDFINMIISLFRYASFFYMFFSFIAFAVFLLALALSIYSTEYKEVAVNTQPNYAAPQGGAPVYQQSAPQYQQAAPQYQQPVYQQGAPAAAPQGGAQRSYDPGMFKMDLQVDGFCGLVKHILLLLFTLGIWSYIWVYRTTEFLNRTDREQQSAGMQVLLCILVPFYTVYWYYKNAQRIDRFAAANGVYSNLETPCLVCSLLLGGAAAVLMQEKINCVLYTIYLNGGQMPQPVVPQYQPPVYQQGAAPQYQQPQYQQPVYQQPAAAPVAPAAPAAPQNPVNQ